MRARRAGGPDRFCRARRGTARRRLADRRDHRDLRRTHRRRRAEADACPLRHASRRRAAGSRSLRRLTCLMRPRFAAHGVRLERLLLVETRAAEDNLWACEQALRASCCGAVLLWQDHVHERALRRLQLAAESSGTALFLFRSARVAPASPAALRLHVSRAQGRTDRAHPQAARRRIASAHRARSSRHVRATRAGCCARFSRDTRTARSQPCRNAPLIRSG